MLEIKKVQNKDDEMLEWGGEERCSGIYIPSDASTLES
ncbi:hypothetical protein SDC9_88141 [bioreactor metagenome]|uniref:Uncharacterized protein n=1 Tax=bioreactor metagenome TaxID=1076179 RepID=A0A644ZL22_9ZZZZ